MAMGNWHTCICIQQQIQCQSSHDVNLVIRLTKFGNVGGGGELVHMYMHSAPIFNVDPAMMLIW
jgi:hypothetical protein